MKLDTAASARGLPVAVWNSFSTTAPNMGKQSPRSESTTAGGAVNQSDLAKVLAGELGSSNQAAEDLLSTVVKVMGRALAGGESITFSNFGTFRPGHKKARSISPPDRVEGAARKALRVHFRPSDRLLEAVRCNDPQVTFQKRPRRLPNAS